MNVSAFAVNRDRYSNLEGKESLAAHERVTKILEDNELDQPEIPSCLNDDLSSNDRFKEEQQPNKHQSALIVRQRSDQRDQEMLDIEPFVETSQHRQNAPSLPECNSLDTTSPSSAMDPAPQPFCRDPNELKTPATVSQQLSTFTATKQNFWQSVDQVELVLKDGDVVTIIGQYDVWIRRGCISFMGAVLPASHKAYRVFAPSTHALPSIRFTKAPSGPPGQTVQLSIASCFTGISRLGRINPRFNNIWSACLPSSLKSFEILFEPMKQSIERPLFALKDEMHWEALAAKIVRHRAPKSPQILVCGPKGSGKSSFARFLGNHFLSKSFSACGIGFLDLDPGQPEFSPPGEICLLQLKSYNMGPPFSHPAGNESNKILRSHYIGNVTPREEVHHYLRSAQNLYEHYRKILGQSNCPLIVNCCGWVQGSGLEVLQSLVGSIQPTAIALMRSKQADDTSNAIINLAERTRTILHAVDSQASTSCSNLKPSDMRQMQLCSYFHLDKFQSSSFQWDYKPLCLQKPVFLSYSRPGQDILGILLLGHHINFDWLEDAINGTVLALVAVEDVEDLLDCTPASLSPTTSAMSGSQTSVNSLSDIPSVGLGLQSQEMEFREPLSQSVYRICRNQHDVPYICTGNGVNYLLDPCKTCSIGQVLVRAVDKDLKGLKVVTPIPWETIQKYKSLNVPLVLVGGKTGIPSWSYLEDHYEGQSAHKSLKRWKRYTRENSGIEDRQRESLSEDELGGTAWAPQLHWVEGTNSETGKRRVNRVWRVRRNFAAWDTQ